MAAILLHWYDSHARALPWRVPPGLRGEVQPDPYRIWLSEVMLQQTTVAAVQGYFARFIARWPTIADLARAEDAAVMAEWAGLGYYARARNLLRCARAVQARGGAFPRDEAGLQALPGIGPYTAAAIAAIAFDQSAVVVDGNVERVMARLFAIRAPLPGVKPTLRAHAATLTPDRRAGDYAQAVMDLGATICTPRNPDCGRCPWAAQCRARAEGIAAELPMRTPKNAKPVRLGVVYLARRADGAVLLETRPDGGLLGGMLGLPGGDWAECSAPHTPPLNARWHEVPGEVRHTFTHFHLRLTVLAADVSPSARADRGVFHPLDTDQPRGLPTVMRKALLHGLAALTAA